MPSDLPCPPHTAGRARVAHSQGFHLIARQRGRRRAPAYGIAYVEWAPIGEMHTSNGRARAYLGRGAPRDAVACTSARARERPFDVCISHIGANATRGRMQPQADAAFTHSRTHGHTSTGTYTHAHTTAPRARAHTSRSGTAPTLHAARHASTIAARAATVPVARGAVAAAARGPPPRARADIPWRSNVKNVPCGIQNA